MDRGYISIHRCIEDDELWLKEPFTRGQAWVDLIMLANYKESSFYIRGNLVLVGRGQVARSETHLAKRWRWSRDKVRRFLSYLSTTEKVIQQKSKIISIITIVKYDIYQETRQQTRQQKNIRKTSDNTTYNKVNKENKNNKGSKEPSRDAPDSLSKEVIDYLNSKTGSKYRPTNKKTQALIKLRSHDGFTLEDFKTVINKKCYDWLGTEQAGYLRPETLFGNKFEGYLNQIASTRQQTTQQKDHGVMLEWLKEKENGASRVSSRDVSIKSLISAV